jgi:hypothetical protein
MPIIENVTNIEVTNDITGSSFLKLYIFKENLIQLLLISQNIWGSINAKKAPENIYDLFIISFSETNIQLEIRPNVEFANFNGTKKNLNQILIQKSNYYMNYENGFVSFNVIGYNLGGIWYSMSEYYKNQNYEKLSIISGFKGNVITKPDVKKILFKLNLTSQQENQSINIENLIYFSNKRNYFGYTNDTKNEITCFPLIRPHSYIIATTKLDISETQIIYFENNTSFIIPSVSINEKIVIKNISTLTMRITNDNGENLLFKFVSLGANQNLYNLDYNYNNSYYKFKFNILSLKFVTNRRLDGSPSDQSDNKILINKNTNNITNNQLLENGSDFSNNLFEWGTELPLITRHSYLEQKIVGITEAELNNVDFKYKNLNYDLLVQNKNSSIIDIYIQNYSSLSVRKILQNSSNFGKVDLSNNVLQVILKAKDNMDGKKAFIGYKILKSNYEIFNNLIIPDTYVEIAGVQSNVEKVIINLNKNIGLPATYSSNIILSVTDNDYYDNIQIKDEGSSISGKNPYISIISQDLILNYKVYVSNNKLKFERLNFDDDTISYQGNSNLSEENPAFQTLQDNIYYFDLSDETIKGYNIKFFRDSVHQEEFLDFSGNGFPYATYSRNFEPGEDGSFIQIKIPESTLMVNGKFYYVLLKKNFFNSQVMEGNVILIEGRKTLYHGEMDVSDIDKTSNSGLLTYSNTKFYDPKQFKPLYNVDLSYNNATILDPSSNYFNKYEYINKDISGVIEMSASNVKSFTGDNIVCLVENPSVPLDRFDRAFYFKNTNLIHGKIKIGFSTIYNSDLFTIKDPNVPNTPTNNDNYNNENTRNETGSNNDTMERYLKKIPFDLSNVELNGIINTKNDTNYIVYNTKNFDASMNKTEFLIKYVPPNSDGVERVYHPDVSFNRFSTGDLSDCSQNIFLAADISNGNTYMALIIIKEDLFGISRFEKITDSDAETTALSTSASISNNYKDLNTLAAPPTDISLNFAFVRKKFNFKADISGINRNDDIFLFEPLDYSNNILNHDLSYNEYVVGIFDTSINNLDKISMCKIKLKQTKPFFINTINSGIFVDNSIITSKWVSGDFGLYETRPRDLVSRYIDVSQSTVNMNPDISLNNFKLPLFDSNTYNEFTVEVEYFKCWKNNTDSKITYRINRKDYGGNLLEYDNISSLEIKNPDQERINNHEIIKLDASGNINFNNITSGFYFIGKYLPSSKKRVYKITYQIENYLTNEILNELLTMKLYNFTSTISTTHLGKTVLNMKYLNTPLKLPDSATDESKDAFNNFLIDNSFNTVINTVINKQNNIRIEDVVYQDTDLSSAIVSETGIGLINYSTKQFIDTNFDPSGAYSNLSGIPIYFNVVDVNTISNLNSVIINEKDVELYWDFKNDNLSVTNKFNIYRSQNPTTKEYILIASTTNKYYTDLRAIPYLTVDYKIESVITWEGVEMITGYKETRNFICENNTFEYGRYNNTTKNQKLYQPINTSCQKIGMAVKHQTTGNLFPNSQVLTKAQIYTTLSRAKFRPFR